MRPMADWWIVKVLFGWLLRLMKMRGEEEESQHRRITGAHDKMREILKERLERETDPAERSIIEAELRDAESEQLEFVMNTIAQGRERATGQGEAIGQGGDRIHTQMLAYTSVVAFKPAVIIGQPLPAQQLPDIGRAVSSDEERAESQKILDAARAAEEAGETDEAMRIYEAAVKAGPADIVLITNLAALLTESGEFQQAIDCYEQLDRASKLPSQAHHPYGVALARKGRLDDARAQLRLALETDASSDSVKLELAAVAVRSNDYETAKELVRDVEALAQGTPELLLLQAFIAEHEGDYEAEFNFLRQIEARYEQVPEYWELFASSAYRSQHPQDAIVGLQRLKGMTPACQIIEILPGLLLIQGAPDEAEVVLIDTEKARELTALELTTWGQILHLRGQLPDSLAKLKRAQALDPDLQTAFLVEAHVLSQQNKYREAYALFKKHLTEEPLLASSWSNFGVAASRVSSIDEAIEAHRTAISLDPAQGTHLYNLGCALVIGNYRDEAVRVVKKSFDLDPKLRELAKLDDDLDAIRDQLDLE